METDAQHRIPITLIVATGKNGNDYGREKKERRDRVEANDDDSSIQA